MPTISAEELERRALSLVDLTLPDISQRYKMQEELGSGAQAAVYKAISRKNNSKVAVKVIDARELEDDEIFYALRMEVELLRQLNHPHVVRLIEVCRDHERLYIVQECLGGGELFEQLLAKGPFKEDYALAIFAQVAIAVDFIHSQDIVHRDLKAENLVFAAKGSPVIKFIDFGGASTWSAEDGLSGLVGTPQYVAPEVVMGYGDDKPTEVPYGKGCDLWSMGVLLYVMLSKTMPFRAKEVDQLLKQVVKGRFTFRPEERWKPVSAEAKDLVSKLLQVDPAKRISIQELLDHPWAKEGIQKCQANIPKLDAAGKKKKGGVMLQKLSRIGSSAGRPRLAKTSSSADVPISNQARKEARAKGVSREQQYWYALEISPPTQVQQEGGVKLVDGRFEMENVPDEMRQILEDIQKKKAAREHSTSLSTSEASSPPPNKVFKQPPPPPQPRSAASAGGVSDDVVREETIRRLSTENEAEIRFGAADTMDTLILVGQKDAEIAQLQAQIASLEESVDSQRSSVGAGDSQRLDAAVEARTAAEERAVMAEADLAEQTLLVTKLQAQLNAVSTLYTEAMQREAVLKIRMEGFLANETQS